MLCSDTDCWLFKWLSKKLHCWKEYTEDIVPRKCHALQGGAFCQRAKDLGAARKDRMKCGACASLEHKKKLIYIDYIPKALKFFHVVQILLFLSHGEEGENNKEQGNGSFTRNRGDEIQRLSIPSILYPASHLPCHCPCSPTPVVCPSWGWQRELEGGEGWLRGCFLMAGTGLLNNLPVMIRAH